MGYKATIKNKKLHGPAAARHRLNEKCKSIREEFKTKRWNQNPKARNNGNWKGK